MRGHCFPFALRIAAGPFERPCGLNGRYPAFASTMSRSDSRKPRISFPFRVVRPFTGHKWPVWLRVSQVPATSLLLPCRGLRPRWSDAGLALATVVILPSRNLTRSASMIVIFRSSIPSLALRPANSFPHASQRALPHAMQGSVSGRRLIFPRSGFSPARTCKFLLAH